MTGGKAKPEDIALPTPEEEAAEAARTQAAFSAIIGKKTAMEKPSGSALAHVDSSRNMETKTQFIKYTPRPDAPGYNPAAATRVIQMVPAQVDPMMPPKHKHIKAPPGPAEDPVPVLHAPNKKLTKEEKAAWNIPACISNWKNSRGFTIPLDKRLAADGRGLKDHSISENFATLSESLYEAERAARTEVRLRAQVQQKLAMQEKDQREEELRILANQARMERGGGGGISTSHNPMMNKEATTTTAAASTRVAPPEHSEESDDDESAGSHRQDEDIEDSVAARQREQMRIERKRQREKEMRMDKNMELKKKKLEEDRDVSEKIALGVHTGTGGLGGDVDSRLYN
jgi:SNW domain-containing protein 1